MQAPLFQVYDADNHLYEPLDEPEEAFTRHLPRKFKRDFYFVDVEGRRKVVVHPARTNFGTAREIPRARRLLGVTVVLAGVVDAFACMQNTEGQVTFLVDPQRA